MTGQSLHVTKEPDSMPIYEFHCERCEDSFEQFRSIRDEALPTCPYCESQRVRRLISPTSFQLKGTGWYATDYRRTSRDKKVQDRDGSGPNKEAGGEVQRAT